MSTNDTVFYRGNTAVSFDFSAEEISSDGAILLLEKLERKHQLIKYFSRVMPDERHPLRIVHSMGKLLRQRFYSLVFGYKDANDVEYLKNDPLFKDILDGELASQPKISRFHDGETGQIIVPVLRPGNSHSNKWYVAILKRVLKKITERYPEIKITVRTDSGFSCPSFYELADNFNLRYAIGQAINEVLKQKTARASKAVTHLFVSQNQKHQHFMSFEYQVKTWHAPQRCYSKIESTGKGLNIRHLISNMEEKDAREIYFGFYVKRGDASENRIKEVKNMSFSDRLSNHGFWANFMRLILSCLAYEMFLLIKQAIRKTKDEVAGKWQIDTVRVALLKVGATIKKTKRRIYYKFSKSFARQKLLSQLMLQ